jgi:hypothetical protein
MKKSLHAGHLMILWSCALLAMQLTASAQTLAHRYSFYSEADGATNAVDLVGTNNGTFDGDAAVSGGQLQLDGAGYVQLQQGIVTNDSAVTVEVWADFPPLADQGGWANLFDFGTQDSSGDDSYSISFCVNTDTPVNDLDAAISDFDNANTDRQNCYAAGSLIAGVTGAYVAAVFDPPAGYIAVYVNGTLAGRITGVTNMITPGIRDLDNWIGKDNWPDPSITANLDEFRVWNGALNGLEVAASYQNTFTNIDTNAGSVLTITLSAGSQITLGGQEVATVVATASLITNSADISPLATYSSGNTNILTVDSTGAIHGVGLGSASITASFSGKTSSATVTVIEAVSVLAHRYSFSEPVSSSNTVADSVGTLYATLEGDAVESGGQVLLDGTADTYIDLSSNSFANNGIITGYPSATIDFWATFGTMADWSYGWSFGSEPTGFGGSDYLYFSVYNGAGTVELNESSSGDNFTTGGDFSDSTVHCTTVVDPSTGIMAIYTNGVLSASITGDFSPLSTIATNCIYFGRSLWTDLGPPYSGGDPYLPTNSSFQEIRIYNGALTPVQIAMAEQSGPNSTNINPGALQSFTLQAPASVQWLQAVPLTLRANYANLTNFDILRNSVILPVGLTITSSDTSVLAVSGTEGSAVGLGTATITVSYSGVTNTVSVNVVRAPTAVLTHRYSFNDGTANDSVGTANGTLMGSASISGGQLIIPNITNTAPALDYLQLPYGIITNATGLRTNYNDPTATYNDASVTVEAWATFYPNQYTWAELFDFGNTDSGGLGEYDIHVSVHAGDGDTFIGISDSDNANADYQFEDVPGASHLDGKTNLYIAAVFNPPAGYLAIYTNGVLMGENSSITIPMAGVWSLLDKIGADVWPDPGMQGSVDEFRIYNGVLSPDQIAADYILGPNALSTPPPTGVSLGASILAGNLVISWPVSGTTGYSLYTSSTIGTNAVWTLVSTTPTVVGQNNQVSVPTSGGGASQFYELKN